MKYFSKNFSSKPQFTIFLIFLMLAPNIYCDVGLDKEIKTICLKAESSVKSYFEEKQELPEKYKNFEYKEEISETELNSAIKLLLMDDEERNNFIQTKNNEKKYFKIIILVLEALSVLFILDFEIHFFLRLCFKNDILETSLTNFYKMSPFYWTLYFILNKKSANIFYNK